MSQLANIATRLRSSRLASDSFWALVGSAAGRGLSFIAGVAIARMLGSELYGEYGTIKNTLMMIAIFSSLGMGYSATKFIAESGDDVHRVAATHRIATRLTLLMSGLIAADALIACVENRPMPVLPTDTICGALCAYLETPSDDFQVRA